MKRIYKILSVLLIALYLLTNISIVYGAQQFGGETVHYFTDQSDDWQKISKKVYKMLPDNIKVRVSDLTETDKNGKKGFGGYYNVNTNKIEWGYVADLEYELTCQVKIRIYKNEIGALNVEYIIDGEITGGKAGTKTFECVDGETKYGTTVGSVPVPISCGSNIDPTTNTTWKTTLCNDIATRIKEKINSLVWYAGIQITEYDIPHGQLQEAALKIIKEDETSEETIYRAIRKTITYNVKLATAKVYAIESSKDSSTQYQAFATVENVKVKNSKVPNPWLEGTSNQEDYVNPEEPQNPTGGTDPGGGSGNGGGIEDGTVIGSLNTGTAFTDPTTDANAYKPTDLTTADTGDLTIIAGKIIGIVRNIGVVLGVIFLTVLGLRYMFASIAEKAEYKETMMPYVLGCVLLMAGTVLVDFIYNIATTL